MTTIAGLCQCGCGATTGVAPENDRSKSWVKGAPLKFIRGHRVKGPNRVTRKALGYSVDQQTGCWNWNGRLDEDGRAGSTVLTDVDGTRQQTHAYRAIYIRRKGPIPPGLVLDHTCNNPACVNPDHLEPVTQAENLRRARERRAGAA